jgi:hypothetical protein
MRGDIIFRVYGVHEGREADSFFGAFRSRAEAEARIAELAAQNDAWGELGGPISQPGLRHSRTRGIDGVPSTISPEAPRQVLGQDDCQTQPTGHVGFDRRRGVAPEWSGTTE